MLKPVNPYAAPTASLDRNADEDSPGVWREGKLLAMRQGALLPPRCVRCNCAVQKPAKERTVYWHSPWIYLVILLNIIIYAVVALIVRKTAKINPALCPEHQKQRMITLWAGFPGTILLLLLAIWAFSGDRMLLGLVFALGFLGTALYLGFKGPLLVPTRITKEEVRLKGCSEAFLDSLPEQ
jgi:hypothetical protein